MTFFIKASVTIFFIIKIIAMATSYHAPLQPGSVALSTGVNRAFITAFNMQDRSYLGELDYLYGSESFVWLMESMGNKTKVSNKEFYHWEQRGKLTPSVQIASFTGFGSAGASGVITLTSGSHLNSGTQSPVRVGDVYENPLNGFQAKVTAVNKASANAHTATLVPLRSTETFTVNNNDFLIWLGRTDVGENSDVADSLVNPAVKVTNTTTEIREDHKITDLAAMEATEFTVDGKAGYTYKGTREAEKRFLNAIETKLIKGVDVTSSTFTATGTAGTLSLIEQIKSRGGTFNTSTFDVAEFQTVSRQLDYNGAGMEIQFLQDVVLFQEVQNKLFQKYDQGGILWQSVGGSKEAAAKYGFQSLSIEGRTFHFKKYMPFSPEYVAGRAPATAYYRNFGIVLPIGKVRDKESGSMAPTIEVCYQEIPQIGEFNIYDSGGLARNNKTTKQELINTFVTHKGLRLRGANQTLIVGANV